jgi:hypothetical protein
MAVVVSQLSFNYPSGIGASVINTGYIKVIGYSSLTFTVKSTGRLDVIYRWSDDGISSIKDSSLMTTDQLSVQVPILGRYISLDVYSLTTDNTLLRFETLIE